MEKKALGRGLDALLPTGRTTAEPERGDVQELRLEAIVPNRFQPRQQFSEVELAELTASLKQNGLLQPILVRRKGDGIYELIAGERRFRAAKLAGIQKIPALVRNVSDQESMVLALVENLQRDDLNPMETARAYQRMLNEFGLTQEAIAQKVARDRSSVAHLLRLLSLPSAVPATSSPFAVRHSSVTRTETALLLSFLYSYSYSKFVGYSATLIGAENLVASYSVVDVQVIGVDVYSMS